MMSLLTQASRCLTACNFQLPQGTSVCFLLPFVVLCRFAHNQSGGKTSNGRDSNPKYRGVKKYGGLAWKRRIHAVERR